MVDCIEFDFNFYRSEEDSAMRKLTTFVLVGLCLGLLPDRAQATPESRAAVLFLLIEPGARAIAMG